MPQKKKLPFVTVGFVAVNVLVYVILEILGNPENGRIYRCVVFVLSVVGEG